MNTNGAPTLFAGIPGAQQMGNRQGPGGMNWVALEAVFWFACERMGVDFWEPVTTGQASTLRQVAKEHGLDEKVERVQGWFENWYLYYPFVDNIAVDRAFNFDHKVWDTLTARERHEVIVRLAEHPDPWGETTYTVVQGKPVNPTGRAARLHQVPPEERRTLFQAVTYQREALSG
jgi:hypothetical protein